MNCLTISYKLHAVKQMFARNIVPEEVEFVIEQGEIIATYLTDKPYPSWLRFATVNGRPIHVVVARDDIGTCYIVTAYEPSTFLWNPDFKTKRV